ncbi:immunoglobulin omega chain-like [Carassius auratus]|uniref:immunoglobulin omega chain-like n=1 Tax=Carassius auratus TaxID=7957 RepID=UPI000E4290A3|nr:immunoglobulin omega chain-like [Carassius auratus]
MLIYIVILLSSTEGCGASEVITPKRNREFALEGDINVTLSCNYSGSAFGVHWYRQYAGSPPQFLILEYSGITTPANPPVPGITINHRKTERHVDLIISSAAVSDSALYYCALQPTLTGKQTALYKNLPVFWESSRAAEVITPFSDYQFSDEGESVTLSCSYTGSVRGLHWFREYAGSPPKFLIMDYNGAVIKTDPPVAGVSIHHRKDNSSVDLKISSAAVTDSALYYCALEPTVKGNPLHAVQKAV